MRPTSPHDVGSLAVRALVYWLWTAAVPLLALGMAFERVAMVGLGGWLLLGASGAHSSDTLHTRRSRGTMSSIPAAPGPVLLGEGRERT